LEPIASNIKVRHPRKVAGSIPTITPSPSSGVSTSTVILSSSHVSPSTVVTIPPSPPIIKSTSELGSGAESGSGSGSGSGSPHISDSSSCTVMPSISASNPGDGDQSSNLSGLEEWHIAIISAVGLSVILCLLFGVLVSYNTT